MNIVDFTEIVCGEQSKIIGKEIRFNTRSGSKKGVIISYEFNYRFGRWIIIRFLDEHGNINEQKFNRKPKINTFQFEIELI